MKNLRGKFIFALIAIVISVFGTNILFRVAQLTSGNNGFPIWAEKVSRFFLPLPLLFILSILYALFELIRELIKNPPNYNKAIRDAKNYFKNFNMTKILVSIVILFVTLLATLQVRAMSLTKSKTNQTPAPQLETPSPSATPSPTPTPTKKPLITPTPDPKNTIGDCKGATGSKCEDKSIRISLEACQSGSYVCCQLGTNWEIKSKTDCLQSQQANKQEYVMVTLPHNLKQYYCPKGIDSQAYNMSLDVVNKTIELPDSISQQYFLEATKIVDEFVNRYCK